MSNILLNYSGALKVNYLGGALQPLDWCRIATSCIACWALQTHAAQHAPLAPPGWLELLHRRWTIWSNLKLKEGLVLVPPHRPAADKDRLMALARVLVGIIQIGALL